MIDEGCVGWIYYDWGIKYWCPLSSYVLGYSPWTSQDFSVSFVWADPALWLSRGYFSGYRRNLIRTWPVSQNSFFNILCFFFFFIIIIFFFSILTSSSSSTSWNVRAWRIQGTSSWSCVDNRTSESSWCFQGIFSIPAEDLLLTQGVAAWGMCAKFLHRGIITACWDRELAGGNGPWVLWFFFNLSKWNGYSQFAHGSYA